MRLSRLVALLILASGLSLLAADLVCAQGTTEQRLGALEKENARIRDELRRTQVENKTLHARIDVLEDTVSKAGAPALEMAVDELVQSAPALEGAPVTAGVPIVLYGFVRLDAYYNTARANNVIAPFWVLPEDGVAAKDDDDQFAFDSRLTRLGLTFDAGTVGAAQLSGRVEVDFASFVGDGPEAREVLRLRLGYFDIAFDEVTFRLGQDWEVVSPLIPMVNSESIMQNVGNLADRRPMAQVIWTPGDREGLSFDIRAAAGLTGAFDNQDLDAGLAILGTSERDGFDSGHPHGQFRCRLSAPSWVDGERMSVGAWGAVAGLETDTSFGGNRNFTSWLIGIDWELPIITNLTLRGQFWRGQALSDFFGGIGQSINTATGDEIRSTGGFIELRWRADEALEIGLGASIDDPDDSDLPSLARSRNRAFWLGIHYDWGSGLTSGFEAIYWKTDWLGTADGDMVRYNVYMQLSF